MPTTEHTLRLQPAPTQRDSEVVQLVTRCERPGYGPLFRSPTFPTPHQLGSELPFSVNFRAQGPQRT
ncbi:MAG TPA: hypothetical protein VGE76_14170 [Opitutaceae bacterium]